MLYRRADGIQYSLRACDTTRIQVEVPSRGAESILSRAEALALAVGRAAEFGVFRPLCLVRAVALNRVLERHGIRGSRVRVGVRMRNGRFAAHAWVEYGDRVLGDNEAHVGSFVELSEVRLVDAR